MVCGPGIDAVEAMGALGQVQSDKWVTNYLSPGLRSVMQAGGHGSET
jgi:hypothetical protein